MADINESHLWQLKREFGGSFSDADSGYDDPGVLISPTGRTVSQIDTGLKESSPEWEKRNNIYYINHKTANKYNENTLEGMGQTASVSTTSLSTPLSISSKTSVTETSKEDLRQLNPSPFEGDSESDLTIDPFDWENFEILNFQKESTAENEEEKRLRFLSAPRDKRGRPIHNIRHIQTSQNTQVIEQTTRKNPRKRFRSKSADGRKVKGPQNIFSPIYSKILSPETMRKRKFWGDLLKKDCILEEEFFKVPYEECNREVIFGRYASPETLLYNFRRLKKQHGADEIKGFKDNSVNEENNGYGFHKSTDQSTDDRKYPEHSFTKTFNKHNTTEKNDDVNYPFLYSTDFPVPAHVSHSKPNNSTDHIQQLINDLNNFAISEMESKENDDSGFESKITPSSEQNYKHENDYLNNHNYSIVPCLFSTTDRKPSYQLDDSDVITEPKRKTKPKKKVSFSNENEELVFDSTFSDSESSVFEDNLEPETNLNWNDIRNHEDDLSHCNNEKYNSNHDSFVVNKTQSHDCAPLPSENITEKVHFNWNDDFGDMKNNSMRAKSSKTRNNNHFYTPETIQIENNDGMSVKNNKRSANFANDAFYCKDMKNKTPHDIQEKSRKHICRAYEIPKTRTTPFYNSLPFKIGKEKCANKTKKMKQNLHGFKEDFINIYMTNGPSFADHEIHLATRTSPSKFNVTVSRIRVPLSSIRDHWQWDLYLQQRKYPQRTISPPLHSSSPSFYPGLTSPTPSCESANSFAGGSSTTSGCSVDLYSPPLSPFRNKKNIYPTSL